MQKLIGLVRRCVEDYKMIEDGDRIAVGVSGGKDSVALLVFLAELRKYNPSAFHLEAITIDMGLGMDYSAVETLCRVIDATEGPLILMGDFNMYPDHPLLDQIRSRLTEVLPEGEGFVRTFPSWTQDARIPDNIRDHPYCKIDYIFVTKHFKNLGCWVLQTRASDHMPMVAEFEI